VHDIKLNISHISFSATLFFFPKNSRNIFPDVNKGTPRGVVGREYVGTAFPYIYHVLLQNELEVVSKWLVFGSVPTSFLLVLRTWIHLIICLFSEEIFRNALL